MRRMSGFTPARRRLAALGPALLLLLTVAASAYEFTRMRATRGWVRHSREVLVTAERVSTDLLQAESGQRGFVLTADTAYLPAYLTGLGGLDRDTAELRRLTRDNESQQLRLDQLAPLVHQRLGLLARGIALREMGIDTAVTVERLEHGRVLMDSVHTHMAAIEREELALLEVREGAERREVGALIFIFLLGVVLVGVLAYVVNRALSGYADAQTAALDHVADQHAQLQEQAAELELQRDSLGEQATELEMLNEQLGDRTLVAEQAQERAEAERRRSAGILASISDAFFILDAAGCFKYANVHAEELFGRESAGLIGQKLWQVVPRLRASFEGSLRRAARTRQVVRFEEYYPERAAYFAVALYPSEDGIAVLLHDVTQSRATQAEFRVMTETMPHLVWSARGDGYVDYWNEQWLSYTGMPRDGDLNQLWLEYLHPDDRVKTKEAWDRSVAQGKPYDVQYRIRRAADGEYRWFIGRGLPVRAPDGTILRWFGSCTDIHEQRTASEAVRALSGELKARVDEMEAMLEMVPVGIAIASDADCTNIRTNRAMAALLNVPSEENISSGRPDAAEALPWTEWRNGRRIPVESLPMQLAARTGRTVNGEEMEMRFRDGRVMHVYAWAAPLFDENGAVRGAVAALVDVTARIEATEKLRRLAERTAKLYALSAALTRAATPEQVGAVAGEWGRDVLGAVACMFFILTPDGTALEPLDTAGMRPEFVRRWTRIPVQAHVPLAEAARTGSLLRYTCAAERDAAFPEVGWPGELQAMFAAPLRFEARTLGAWAVHFDAPRQFTADDIQLFEAVTVQCAQALERARLLAAERSAREQAEQANQAKLKFLRVMSHDLRTPLNAILGYTELLQDSVPGPLTETQRTYLGRIRASTTVLRLLIDDILEFARIEAGRVEIRPADVPVQKLLESVEALMGEQVRARGIRLLRCVCEPALAVRADPERARQVLMNLVSNAQKFTAAGGEIALECSAADERVRIAVRDTGVGIDPESLEQIFEPFVQAHRPQELGTEQGVGLGLAISRELARAMGGDVTASGQPGVGSVFTLELPRAPAPAPAQPSPIAAGH